MNKKYSPDEHFIDKDLRAIQSNFHKLINEAPSRSWDQPTAKKYLEENAHTLPKITNELLDADEPQWFSVAGMYGGFRYELKERNGKPILLVSSWSRVIGGSGQTHEITIDGIKRTEVFDA